MAWLVQLPCNQVLISPLNFYSYEKFNKKDILPKRY